MNLDKAHPTKTGTGKAAVPLLPLFGETLQVPLRGQLKLAFVNKGPTIQEFLITLKSMRFDLLETTHGKFPVRQFSVRLEPEGLGEVTVVDRVRRATDYQVETLLTSTFKEGSLCFETGLYSDVDLNGVVSVTDDEGGGKYLFRFLRMEDETPSYKELCGKIEKEVRKRKEASDKEKKLKKSLVVPQKSIAAPAKLPEETKKKKCCTIA